MPFAIQGGTDGGRIVGRRVASIEDLAQGEFIYTGDESLLPDLVLGSDGQSTRARTPTEDQAAVEAEAELLGIPLTLDGYRKWFRKQAIYAASNFIHGDNLTGTTYYYDIYPESRIWIQEAIEAAKDDGSASLIVSTVEGGPDSAVDHTLAQLSELQTHINDYSIGKWTEFLQLQGALSALPNVDAIASLTLPSWASLP